MREFQIISLSLDDFTEIIKKTVSDCLEKPTKSIDTIEPEFLTRLETSKILKVSLPTLSNWTKTGKIKSYRNGRNVRYKRDDVNKVFIEIKTIKGRL
jgi:excisionase family DNA binding protein